MIDEKRTDPQWESGKATRAGSVPDNPTSADEGSAAVANAPLVDVRQLTREFDVSRPWLNRMLERLPRRILKAVSDVSFSIGEKQVYGLVGESGSGKSTIGKVMVGLQPPTSGSVTIAGVDLYRETDASKIAQVRSDIQMIFQDPYASLNPRWRVGDIIAEPLVAIGRDTTGVAAALLEQVGLAARDERKFPHEFSGGQRQRISIARALAAKPRFIVCDEPTSALDVSVQAQVLNLMTDLQHDLGLTYLFISHDLTVVRHMSDRVGVLYLGRIVEEADAQTLFDAPKHPYTQMLLDAAPRPDQFGRVVDPPKGEVPDPIDPPGGCPYHPRCPIAEAQCRETLPALRAIGNIRVACHLAG